MSIYTHTYQVKETEVPIIIPDEKNKSEISSKKNLKNRLTTGTVALLMPFLQSYPQRMRGMYITQAVIPQKSVWQQEPELICRSAIPTAEPTGQPQCWTVSPED